MKSILAVTSELPWPLDTGGHLRSFHLLSGLAQSFEVRLVTAVAPGREDGVRHLQQAGVTVHAVSIPARGRMREIGRIAAAAVSRTPYVLYARHDHPAVRAEIRRAIGAHRPDLLYLDHLDSAVYAEEAGATPIVADLHNIYSLLAQRAGDEHRSWMYRTYLRREARLLADRERRLAGRASAVFAVSAEECDYFRTAGAAAVHLVPNGVACRTYADLPVGRTHAAPTILYLGTMSWAPNAAAARFLADDVLPQVRQRVPGARLVVVGKNPPGDLVARSGRDGVEVTGGVPDVLPYLRDAAVLAVPLEAGGGTRLKILEAFAAGLPVLSTPVGAEGIAAVDGQHLEIANRDEFAGRLAALLADPGRGAALARQGRDLAATVYDWPVVADGARRAIEALLRDRRTHAA